MSVLNNVSRLPQRMPLRRSFSSDSSAPLMWKLTHGMFDPETPMTEKLPGIPDPIPIDPPAPLKPQVSTLPNGVRVVSQELGGSVSSVALFVGAGSRHENPLSSGVSHLLERLAFKGSSERSKYHMVRDMERTGAMYNAAASRETISFAAEGLREKVPDMIPILTESAVSPIIGVGDEGSAQWDEAVAEVAAQKKIIKEDLENVEKDSNAIVTEAIHAVAYHGNTLGLPLIPKEHKLSQLNPYIVRQFVSEHFTAGRLVISAANYDHDELVKLTEAALGHLPRGDGQQEEARYTGGGTQLTGAGAGTVAIGLKGVSWHDEDLVAICVLHTLLGGGGSFSSGGPGKGMYTRLYSEVLNRHGWVSNATAFNHCYADSGLFGIQASCVEPGQLNELLGVVGSQIGRLADGLKGGELERAKAMTKSSLVMNLESRAIVCEDLGRQVLCSGQYAEGEELVQKIEKVSEGDIQKVVKRLLSSSPSVVTYGEEFASMDTAAIESAIQARAKIAA